METELQAPPEVAGGDAVALAVAPETTAAPRAWPRLGKSTTWALGCLAVDTGMLVLAALATAFGSLAASVPAPPTVWTIGFGALAIAFMRVRGLYELRLHLPILDDVRRVAMSITLAAMIVVSVRLLLSASPNLAAETIRPWGFALVYVAAGRVALYWSQTKARRGGESLRPALIVGAGRVGALTAKRLLDHPELGLRPVAFLDKEPLVDTNAELGLPVAGASWDLESVLEQYDVEQVIVTFSTAPDSVLLALVRRCEELRLPVSIVPRLYERVPERLSVEHLGGLPLITAHPADPHGTQYAIKYAIDKLVAATLLLLVSPILLVVGAAIWLDMRRPIFFRQRRVGADGKVFHCLKFRSMKLGTETPATGFVLPDGAAPGGVEGEDRRTVFGALLRRSSLDELPQLINVLKGEMSIVGPRPERPEYVSQFERSIYRYGDRHRVRSGITGWAQVHGLRGKTSVSDRAEWDNYYVENFSLWLDLKILLMTFAAVITAFRDVE